MNKDQVKGTAEKVKGKVNEAVGNATDDAAQKAKGQLQQGAGEARKQYGDLKEDVKDGAKKRTPDRDDLAKNAGLTGVFCYLARLCRQIATPVTKSKRYVG
jgi:uncharacterized protein YjbJ (UPF0337 family)